MPRTTEAKVKEIIDTTLSVEEVKPFLVAANRLVTARLTGAYDDGLLIEIEKHLTAYFISARDPEVKSETIGDASITYVKEGADSNSYLNKVRLFDYKGLLFKIKGEIDIEAFG
jgi:hypothetical protein